MSGDAVDILKEAGRKVVQVPVSKSKSAVAFTRSGRMDPRKAASQRMNHVMIGADDSGDGGGYNWEPGAHVVDVPHGYKSGAEVGYDRLNTWLKHGMQKGAGARKTFVDKNVSQWANANPKHIKSLGMSVEGDGFAVLPEYAPDIYNRVYESDIFSRTANYTVSGKTMKFPKLAETNRNGKRHGGVVHFWKDEAEAYTQSSPSFDTVNLELKKVTILIYLTEELIEDNSYSLEQFVVDMASREIEFALGNGVVNGPGGDQMLGVLNDAAAHTVDVPRAGAASSIQTEDLLKMLARRLRPNESTWGWFYNQECIPQLGLLRNGTIPLFITSESGGLRNDMPNTILGIPAVPSEFMPAVADRGCIGLFDWSKYVTISKGELRQASSTHVEFLTDQLALKFSFRVDGRPFEDTPIEPFKAGDTQPETQSSFIVLA